MDVATDNTSDDASGFGDPLPRIKEQEMAGSSYCRKLIKESRMRNK